MPSPGRKLCLPNVGWHLVGFDDFAKPRENVLMIDQRQGQVIPLSTYAFAHASGSIEEVRSKNTGNLIVYKNGSVSRILNIEKSAPPKSGLVSRLHEKLTQAIPIVTTLSVPTNVPFSEMKDLVRDLVHRDSLSPDPYLQPIADFDGRLRACDTWEAAFLVLNVPAPGNALDLMC